MLETGDEIVLVVDTSAPSYRGSLWNDLQLRIEQIVGP
jgi:hypothetical protein